MESDDTPRPGQSRLSDVGDYEIFDGERWRPVASLLADPEDGNREGRDGRRADAAGDVPAGTGSGAPADSVSDTVSDNLADRLADTLPDTPGGGTGDGHRDFLRDGPGGAADLPSDR